LSSCRQAGINFNNVPGFSDCGRGLFSTLSYVSLGTIVQFCTIHIIENIKSTFPGEVPVDLENIMYRSQAADTPEEFKSMISIIVITHLRVAAYIEGIPAERWTMQPSSVHHVK
jgi:hypothetical protein